MRCEAVLGWLLQKCCLLRETVGRVRAAVGHYYACGMAEIVESRTARQES